MLVTDIRMPGVSGIRILKEVKDHYPKTKVILMTAYGSIEMNEVLKQFDMEAYIEKPFEINDFRRLVHQCLKKDGNGSKKKKSL